MVIIGAGIWMLAGFRDGDGTGIYGARSFALRERLHLGLVSTEVEKYLVKALAEVRAGPEL